MKTLDDFIHQHGGMFDNEEPGTGHEERFRSRLNKLHSTRRPGMKVMLFRVAAVLVLGIVISYFAVKEFRLIDNQINNIALDKPNLELNEAEKFYTTQLNIYYNKIQHLGFNNDKAEKKKVLQELSAMDEQVQAMKYDLKQNPDDERVMSAIINFYQVKIEMMDVIIARAQKTNTTIL
jgi:hypothetical protein